MSPVISFLNVPLDLKVVQCCLFNLRKCSVALSNLRVKGPIKLHNTKTYMEASIQSPFQFKETAALQCGLILSTEINIIINHDQ